MTRRVADDIIRGLEQAIAFSKGELDPSEYRVYIPAEIDTKRIRAKLGMTQKQFAATFAISLDTLRHWEQGRRCPDRQARVLLKIIDHDPQAVLKALNAA